MFYKFSSYIYVYPIALMVKKLVSNELEIGY